MSGADVMTALSSDSTLSGHDVTLKTPPFLVMSVQRFVLLYVVTMGFYSTVWFYLQWKQYRKATGVKVLPALRAFLGIFMVFSLFRKIDNGLKASGLNHRWFPITRGISIVVLAMLLTLGTFIPVEYGDTLWVMALNYICAGVVVFLFAGVQRAINVLGGDVEGKSNAGLTLVNGLWMGFFGCMWVLFFIGLYTLLVSSY